MDVHDMFCDVQVRLRIAFIEDNEEEIETTHNRCAHHKVGPQGLFSVISAPYRVGSGQDGGASIQSGMDACLGDRYGLLFHSFVDGDLIRDIHLVEFVDCANTVVSKHERPSFNRKVSCFFILDNCSRQTSRRRGFA